MKKTLTVNLGGTVYHIDEDAYNLLDNYLNNIRLHFRKQQGAEEIVNDMENRIAELFSEKVTLSKQVITISDVEEVISRMGKPEDFEDNSEYNEFQNNSQQIGNSGSDAFNQSGTAYRRLYRDPDEKMLGGVAAGLAAYLGWDITLVRILMVILVFIPYCPAIIFYLIAWIVIPEARTAAEKLSMRGQAVTVENIGKTVTDGFERVSNGVNDYVNSGKPRSFLQKAVDFFLSVVAFIFKLVLVILAIAICPFLLIAAIVLVVALIGIIALLLGLGGMLFGTLPAAIPGLDLTIAWNSPWTFVAWIVLILFFGIPLFALVHTIFRSIFNWTAMSKRLRVSLLLIWLFCLLLVPIFFFMPSIKRTETYRYIHYEKSDTLVDTIYNNKDTIRIDTLQY